MKLSYSPYELSFRRGGGVRQGMLVRIEKEKTYGYADCHPWVEYGDAPLTEQITALKSGSFTPILERSIHFSLRDWDARRQNQSLFKGLPHIPCYALVSEPQERVHPFQKLKIRPGDEASFLQNASKEIRWRLDFNSSFDEERCTAFLQKLQEFQIDYIEDPLPSCPGLWKSLQAQYGIPFAADFENDHDAQFLVEKPAVKEPSLEDPRRRVITSYLDHPIGQLSALYTAARIPLLRREPGGFLSHLVYKENAFSEQLLVRNGILVPPDGPGCGFQDLLEKAPWK